jgi:hypothetical protein
MGIVADNSKETEYKADNPGYFFRGGRGCHNNGMFMVRVMVERKTKERQYCLSFIINYDA